MDDAQLPDAEKARGNAKRPTGAVTREERQRLVREIFAKIKSHQAPYEVSVAGVRVKVMPNVFSPRYFTDSAWFASEVAGIVGNGRLLEIGTGTGIVALFAGLGGAGVVATDINPDAAINARINFQQHGIQGAVLEGDLFAPLPAGERFDVIFWNHPFNRGEDAREEMLLRAGFDYQYQTLERYISEGRDYLREGGKLLLGTGEIADLSEIERLAAAHGCELILLRKATFPLEPGGEVTTDYRIYECKEQRRNS
jgi:release factor glutamine methyltransferase